MAPYVRDRVAGVTLLLASLVWVALVIATIPASQDTSVGARGFPLVFGIALACLSLALLLGTLGQHDRPAPTTTHHATSAAPTSDDWGVVVLTIGGLIAYGFLMETIGFMPATALFTAVMMVVVLRLRSPLLILGLSLGLAVGCFAIFGKLLGGYLPPGTWITINL